MTQLKASLLHSFFNGGCYSPPPPEKAPRQSLQFRLTADHIALCDLLKVTGLTASGGQSKALIADGQVRVDGRVDTRKTAKIRAGQSVECLGTRIQVMEQ